MRRSLKYAAVVCLLGIGVAVLFIGCQTARHMGGAALNMSPSSNGFSSSAATARESAPSGSLPALDEEVWVIVKPDKNFTAAPAGNPNDELPGTGALVGRFTPAGETQSKDVPLPLKHTDVQASITAYIASVEVTQQFANPFDSKIEAVYVFPLPENAAIIGFVMTVGDRKIRGIIREREEAQRIYNEAKTQGYVASLLTQERPNVFTQSVANIEPGKQIDVNITYFHTLAYDDGWYEYVFPMVVGPRFNPPGTTDGIGAVALGASPGKSGQKTQVQYLKPHERSGHDISLTVNISAGVPIEQIKCNSHKIEINNQDSEQARVALSSQDSIPNKDFVLHYRVAGERVKAAMLAQKDASGGGYFTFMLFPPGELSSDDSQRQPLELIFVLDCSGSMNGAPIAQSKAAIDHALTRLQPSDTFQVVQFSNTASQLGPAPMPATQDNILKARQYVQNLNGEGGTMMIEGIKTALDFPHDSERLRFIAFLTDGYVGNESQILGEVHNRLGSSRIFSFGVGSSPNRFLLDRMAKLGSGAVAYLGLNDSGKDVMEGFFNRISHPVMTDISLDWGAQGAKVSDVLPERVPDLFVGRPVILSGRFTGEMPPQVRVTGQVAKHTVRAEVAVNQNTISAHNAIAAVWARSFIADLMDRATYDSNTELPQQIKSIALQYGLMSSYTSFVAVDSSTKTMGDHGTTVQVAVPTPQGVRYGTTVHE